MTYCAPIDPEQFVTASDLVRHFGLWQDRAARAPIYVLHHGRPRLVLTSVQTMHALCAAQDGPDVQALLDTTSDLVLIADDNGRIVASSRVARAHFGAFAASGARLDAVVDDATRASLTAAIRRVIDSGRPEKIEVASVRGIRLLSATLAPVDRGIALVAQDLADERNHAHVRAARDALGQAMTAAGGAATAMLSPSGYIVDPGPALAALTRQTPEALTTIPFVALADASSRSVLGAALDRLLQAGRSDVLDMILLVRNAASIAVRIGLAPIRTGPAIDGAIAVIVQRPYPPQSG